MNTMKKLRLQAALKPGGKLLTQKDVAREIGVRSTSVSKWECGQAMPTVDKLPALAKLYGCTVEELVEAVPRSAVPKE
ncbi:MAG: helix-turn-helix transcriptional regulator [Oscillospiraceae bacterium]|nr:helix-turn-helix transcriptional regulator [Oscillospiraceae bacterium]